MSNDEADVRALEQARIDALCVHDVDAVGALMDEELVHVHATGVVQNRVEYLAHLKLLPRQTARRSLFVRVYGDVAVLTGEVSNTLIRPGKTEPETNLLCVTQVARRVAGGWTFVSFHACRV